MRHNDRQYHRDEGHSERQGSRVIRGRGGRRPRVLDGGQLRLVLLTLISQRERHGYDLIREIEGQTGGAYAPSPGVVYPTLTLLLEMDLISEGETDGPKKLFEITDAGRAHLEELASDASAAMSRIAAIAERQSRLEPAPIRRAMENLKTALNDKLAESGTDKKTVLAVAGLVDEAASKIERL
ncbi:PadR family transcriptional regulator [Nisaea denitrificans]|uniref:PadR family transcriptional regulator n=1 Tax=Nisaea denitrificans TaxID=390877 RepID=UPI000A0415E8|nr:PadR family transcriptional regulator [Nisaea denitrificans]